MAPTIVNAFRGPPTFSTHSAPVSTTPVTIETASDDNLSPTAAGNTNPNTKAVIVALPALFPLPDDVVVFTDLLPVVCGVCTGASGAGNADGAADDAGAFGADDPDGGVSN